MITSMDNVLLAAKSRALLLQKLRAVVVLIDIDVFALLTLAYIEGGNSRFGEAMDIFALTTTSLIRQNCNTRALEEYYPSMERQA
jgi:hypothetical protein